MTITTLLMMLALTVGSKTIEPIETTDYSSCPAGRVCKIASHCWVNGTWTTPCPDDAPPPPPPREPEILLPYL